MPDIAIGHALQELGSLPETSSLDRSPCHPRHVANVHAVGSGGGDLKGLGARKKIPASRHFLPRRELTVSVVLTDEHDRELEDLREVQALMEVAMVCGTLAE